MNIMTKRGNLDNVVTFEHVCDETSDMANIPSDQITLGSTCIVLQGTYGLEVYMAGSDKQWVSIMETSGGSGGGSDGPTVDETVLTE